MPAAIDLTNRKYGRLTVIAKDFDDIKKRKWFCKCDCGNTKSVDRNAFIRGLTTSCGCAHKEIMTTHGEHATRLYNIWQNMKARCASTNFNKTEFHGSRGVTVCQEWQESFIKFRDWAHTNGYAEDLSIDRVNGAKVYGPETCQWATATLQSRNVSSHTGSSSMFIGVSRIKETGRFRASINVDKQRKHIGVFTTEQEAAKARDAYVVANALEGFTINFK